MNEDATIPQAPGPAFDGAALGLADGAVALTAYDRRWPALYREEAARFRAMIGPRIMGLAHIGATSVPGLGAQPVLDMVMSVAPFPMETTGQALLLLMGYRPWPVAVQHRELQCFVRGPAQGRTHRLFVTRINSDVWTDLTRFRDYLAVHPAAAEDYARLKRRLAAEHAGSPEAYAAGKADFVFETLKAARQEAGT